MKKTITTALLTAAILLLAPTALGVDPAGEGIAVRVKIERQYGITAYQHIIEEIVTASVDEPYAVDATLVEGGEETDYGAHFEIQPIQVDEETGALTLAVSWMPVIKGVPQKERIQSKTKTIEFEESRRFRFMDWREGESFRVTITHDVVSLDPIEDEGAVVVGDGQ